jgi:predicted ATP-dependent endonuclease of OLD family
MKITLVAIQNFRKLQKVKIDFSGQQTVLVGANNSGKTSAMDALIFFLDRDKYSGSSKSGLGKIGRKISISDFTISNWTEINTFGNSWLTDNKTATGNTATEWIALCPSIDVWLDATVEDVVAVSHLIPSLDWNGEPLGVRLVYQPKDIGLLKEKFVESYRAAEDLVAKERDDFKLWPKNLQDFLTKELSKHFEIQGYLLPTDRIEDSENLKSFELSQMISQFPFSKLFKVGVIDAQRGFSDSLTTKGENKGESLSPLLTEYYDNHLNPADLPEQEDVKALEAIDHAQNEFNQRLKISFEDAINEIETLGYPGFSDPKISLSTKLDPKDGLGHEAAVKFSLSAEGAELPFELPESLNGLGYKNLIYMIFKLISFRDDWMLKGKAKKRSKSFIEPLHLVFIEEPEAHLHAQVQQVFIRRAYDVLTKQIANQFSTQLIVSSHSSYLAHEVEFEKLRYFRRNSATFAGSTPTTDVVNLSTVFAIKKANTKEENHTAKFVSRYIKTTHCDLFFANGIIMVEGAAERMLLPHFIKNKYEGSLNNTYLSILEVGGAHAHRLRSLIEILKIPTLVITDADAIDQDDKKVQPKLDPRFRSGSYTLKTWFELADKNFEELMQLPFGAKIKGNVCAVYQFGITVKEYGDQLAIPYTFEDALALSNVTQLRELETPTGMLKKMKVAAQSDTLVECSTKMFEELSGDKAQMALDVLYDIDPNDLTIPFYISEGLDWLVKATSHAASDFLITEDNSDAK